MKKLIYQVAVGKPSHLYTWCMDSVKTYCERHGIDHHIQTEAVLKIAPDPKATGRSHDATAKYGGFLPIFEKENAFSRFPEYDQILILDADIFVRADAPNIFDDLQKNTDFAGVIERDMPITPAYSRKIIAYSKGQYGPLLDVNWTPNSKGHEFYNMGLMLMNKSITTHLNGQSPTEFIRRPEFKRFVDGTGKWKWSTDQTLLNYWVRKSQMNQQHLSWKWNALYRGVCDRNIPEAHFIHFFLKDHLPQKGENVNMLKDIVGV